MSKVAIATDSNSGITLEMGEKLGIHIMPMPFYINGELFLEDITLTQDQFYEKLADGVDIHTAAPAVADLTEMWEGLLGDYDELIYIPMSSGLSGSCATCQMLAQEEEFEGRVFVVDNQRITVTQRQSAVDAKALADAGKSAQEIYDKLMENKMDSSVYIMLDTLYYLRKGGRLTPAAAALGTMLRIKPVLQIQGEKLDAFARARTVTQAKRIMIDQVMKDCRERYGSEDGSDIHIAIAYTHNPSEAEEFKKEVLQAFPRDPDDIIMEPLSLSVACHIGPGALVLTDTKPITID